MSTGTKLHFREFVLDPANLTLHRDLEKVVLRPKTFGVIRYLAENADRLITKQEIKSALWPSAAVVDAALRVSIQEIRKALGDNPAQPRFIQTVGKNGYRFIAPVNQQIASVTVSGKPAPIVGRGVELDRLQQHFEVAEKGKRQIVFVTGEPGIGKTTLVETFARGMSATGNTLVAIGQCIEQYGAGEAYLPVLDVLERLCKPPNGSEMINRLRRLAPSWMVSLPGLVSAEERVELARQTVGSTAERRIREIVSFLENISESQPLILLLEDLHWGDPSTLALISYLARRREPDRLLLIGTYRDLEIDRSNHPLRAVKAELLLHHNASHLPVSLLTQSAVGDYLAARFSTDAVSQALLSTVYGRSEGNPLFMVNMTDYLVDRDAIVRENGSVKSIATDHEDLVPESIRDLIERQISALPREDQELLETASVQGATFSVAVIARVLDQPREEIERRFRDLATRSHFLQEAGSRRRPNGRGTARYKFIHALYQNVIYDCIDIAKRRCLHQAVGERTEAAYQGATEPVAAELAMNFERAGDYARAAKYLLVAAQSELGKSGYHEAIIHATKGLSLIQQLTADSAVNDIELSFQLLLGVAYANSQGFAAPEARAAFSKARELSRRNDNDHLLFRTFFGLWSFHMVHADLPLARTLGNELVTVAVRNKAVEFNMIASMSTGITDFYLGRFSEAHHNLAKVVTSSNAQHAEAAALICGWNPLLGAGTYDAHSLWFLGFPDRALVEINKSIELARQYATPYDQALTYALIATYFTYSGDPQRSLLWCDSALNIARESGFDHWTALATILKGSANCKLGQIDAGKNLIEEGVSLWKATGADKAKPVFYAFEAEAWLLAQDRAAARAAIDRGLALSQVTKDSYYDAELWRLKGEAASEKATKRECFDNAARLARNQKAKSLELRATMSLCRLWRKAGKNKEAKRMLAKIYGWFTEGFDTPDLKAAKELLHQLS